MTCLNNIKSKIPLPADLEPYLWRTMEEFSPKKNEVLVEQGKVPKHAYFIIRGHVMVYYFDEDGEKHVKRFYREGKIVALLSLIEQQHSPYYIVAGRNTMLSRISSSEVQYIYDTWKGMKELGFLIALQDEETKEQLRQSLVCKPGIDKVSGFYRVFPDFLHGRLAKDEEVASYLLMKHAQLRAIRSDLLRRGILPQKKKKALK